ncbi:hypothetical protein Tco_1408246 [Tanacetum coccineum]
MAVLESCPKHSMFWTSAKSQTINNVRYINAKVAGKPVTISEASIRSDLRFNDVDGIDSLNNQAIFDAIKLMGHKSRKLTKASQGLSFIIIKLDLGLYEKDQPQEEGLETSKRRSVFKQGRKTVKSV